MITVSHLNFSCVGVGVVVEVGLGCDNNLIICSFMITIMMIILHRCCFCIP